MIAPAGPSSAAEEIRDREFLLGRVRPDFAKGSGPLRIVDLFSGAGGISLGIAEAARRSGKACVVEMAVDTDADAVGTFSGNLPTALPLVRAVQDVLKSPPRLPAVDVLVGGPPCQGYSSLNAKRRSRDDRNDLYLLMAEAAELLRPEVVVIENVPSVTADSGDVVGRTRAQLLRLGYFVQDGVIHSQELGVPQRRRRHVIVAGRTAMPDLMTLGSTPVRTVRWAISDLEAIYGTSAFDTSTTLSSENQLRAHWLFEHGAFDLPDRLRPVCHQKRHSYRSMYGRMWWDRPAQTITSGYGSPGQGRYVHPGAPRVITPHEAARLQGFPDWFGFAGSRRGSWARMIGNAVPPLLNVRLGEALISAAFS